jgi:hypothetical protein
MKNTNTVVSLFAACCISLTIAGCGGGGSGAATPSGPAQPDTPSLVASAGSAQNVAAGAFLILDGSASTASTGTTLSYTWTLTAKPTGSTATLVAPDTVKPVLKTDLAGSYQVSLTVRDATSTSAAATVVVTAGAVAAPPPTSPAANSIALSACSEITASGSYVLRADASTASTTIPCFSIHDTSNVQLDCANHVVSGPIGFNVTNVQNFSVANCKFQGADQSYPEIFRIVDSTDGSVTNSAFSVAGATLPAISTILRAQRIVLDGNTYVGTLQNLSSNAVTISNNRLSTSPGANIVSGIVVTAWGAHNKILNNFMDGHWDGLRGNRWSLNGADDGVLIQDETDLVVANNVIQNVCDTGIEASGLLTSSTLSGNYILNANFATIGGWYWSSVANTTFSANVGENSGHLFHFFRAYGLRPAGGDINHTIPADTAVLFRDNVFSGNVSINTAAVNSLAPTLSTYLPIFDLMAYDGGISNTVGERAALAADFQLTNNLFKNNVFAATYDAPWFGSGPIVAGRIIDGGGNFCKASTTTAVPFKCN